MKSLESIRAENAAVRILHSSAAFEWLAEHHASVEFHVGGEVTVMVGRIGWRRPTLFEAVTAAANTKRKARRRS